MIISIDELPDFPAMPTVGDTVFVIPLDAAFVFAPGATGALPSGWLTLATGASLRSAERTEDRLTRATYAGRDYQSFLDEIGAHVKKRFGDVFNDFLTSAPGQMIMRYFAAALDTLSWNMDQRATEGFMFLAVLRSSIANLARQLGYKPRVGVAASVSLGLTLTEGPYAFDVPVRAGFRFAGPGGIGFEQAVDVVIPAGSVSVSGVGYFQGETVTESFTSDGTKNQRFRLRRVGTGRFVGKGTVDVFVGGDQWAENDFLTFEQTNQFEVGYDLEPPAVRMGDGAAGNVPESGAEVRISYVATNGRAGNGVPRGSVFSPKSVLTVNFQDIPVTAFNELASTGGDDPEEARSVQANAPMVFSTAQRAVSQADWDALLNTFSDASAGAVARGRAQIIRGVKNELTIQGHLATIRGAGQASASFAALAAANDSVRSHAAAGTAQGLAAAAAAAAILVIRDGVKTTLAAAEDGIASVQAALASERSALGSLPYRETIGLTDGIATTFSGSLSRVPIVPGTVSVFVDTMSVVATDSSGDADAVAGEVHAGAAIFTTPMVGSLVKVGADFRRIRKFVSASAVEYSGPVLFGTGLKISVFSKAAAGFDDAAGSISGTGISSGTVSYATGSFSVTFSATPEGASTIGHPVHVSFRYADVGLQEGIDAISATVAAAIAANVTAAKSGLDDVTPLTDASAAAADAVGSEMGKVAAQADAVDVAATSAKQVGVAVGDAVALLESYLEKVLSGDCKANIVQLRTLVHDANGDFAAPSQLLLAKLKEFFDARRIITTTVSTVSGVRDVVRANLRIRLEIEAPFIFSKVQPAAAAAVAAIFKDRFYAVPLKRSDVYRALVPKQDGSGGVRGIRSASIEITGSTFMDPSVADEPIAPNENGDLVVGDGQVIASGTIAWSEISY